MAYQDASTESDEGSAHKADGGHPARTEGSGAKGNLHSEKRFEAVGSDRGRSGNRIEVSKISDCVAVYTEEIV